MFQLNQQSFLVTLADLDGGLTKGATQKKCQHNSVINDRSEFPLRLKNIEE